MVGVERNGTVGSWESSVIVEGKEGEAARAHRDRGTECFSGLSSEATPFGSRKSFGWGLRGNGISESGKVSSGGRCGGLVKFLKSDGAIRNDNVVSFGIGLPGCSVISGTLLK